MKSHLEQSPPFAPAQAFVVQFGRDTAVDAGRIAGRVEHVVSGKAARFQSLNDLVTFMTAVLREVEEATCRPGGVVNLQDTCAGGRRTS
jgi:hypothetical protein